MKNKKGKRADTGLIGTAGVYEVLSRLTQRGWVAGMTPGNTKGFDIIAVRQEEGGKIIARMLEVKTCENCKKPVNSKFWGKTLIWTMHKKHENPIPGLVYAFVNFKEEFDLKTGKVLPPGSSERSSVYFATSAQVANFAKESHHKWLYDTETTRSHKDTDMRYFCLGFEGGGPYRVESTLMASECWEKWELLEEEI